MSPEQLLIDLALELAAARENLAAVEAFERYAQARFRPARTFRQDYDGKQALPSFPEGRNFETLGRELRVLLAFSIPVVFTFHDCQGDPPSDFEAATLRKAVRIFQERMEEISTLKGLTFTDDLTGLYNQRYLEVILDRELSLATRNQLQFSVLFLDMDHFKNVNDSYGHLIGSRLLFEVGEEIKRTLRESDVTFRYGGDEFLIILTHTGLDDALVVAERIRVQVEKKRFLARENLDIRLTASIGVATVPDHASTKQQILKAADEALYGVKKAVRNRVIAATKKIQEQE